jgi:5'-nucleotidase / UDP-sugar diphosphatase
MYKRLAVILTALVWLSLSASPFQLTLAHINDTHSYIGGFESTLSMPIDVNADGKLETTKVRLEMGGFPRLATCIEQTRREHPNTIFLHGGDIFTGGLFFRLYKGAADAAFLDKMTVDVMTTGNHEYDKGSAGLAAFAHRIDFPIVCANADYSANPILHDMIQPYTVLDVNGQKIGVIGLVTPDVDGLSAPDGAVTFSDPFAPLTRNVKELERQGVNKIVVLSHCGYDVDMDLASRVNGIDVIVGAHTHALLGDSLAFKEFGIHADGPYPTVVKSPDSSPVYIVTARSHTMAFGESEITFDDNGAITTFKGKAFLDCGNRFQIQDGDKWIPVTTDAHPEIYRQIVDRIDSSPVIRRIEPAPWATAMLDTYQTKVDSICAVKLADVPTDISHVRLPGMFDGDKPYPRGSEVTPIICDAFLWQARQTGAEADLAIQNSGSVRTSIASPTLNLGQALEILPYENRLTIIDLTGEQLLNVLQKGVKTGFTARSGAFPYVSGCRYTIVMPDSAHIQVKDLEILAKNGKYQPVDPGRHYHVVTNFYLAAGGDEYDLLTNAPQKDLDYYDSDALTGYAKAMRVLKPVTEERIRITR